MLSKVSCVYTKLLLLVPAFVLPNVVSAADNEDFIPQTYASPGVPAGLTYDDVTQTTCQKLKSFYRQQRCCDNASKVIDLPAESHALLHAEKYYWTQAGLEAIPFDKWHLFPRPGQAVHAPFRDIPYPGDEMTSAMLQAWEDHVRPDTYEDLLMKGYVTIVPHAVGVHSPTSVYFYKPAVIRQSEIAARIQFADEVGPNLGAAARKGRLQTSADQRLREHYYRFPDQCDAVPIAVEVHLRLMLMDQVEAFYRDAPRIGLWQDLFPDVSRRSFDQTDMAVSKWYVSRYAEGYMHSVENGGYVYPFAEQNIDYFMRAVGLDPGDDTMDHTTPQGLGNYIGKKATEWLAAHDGLQKGMDWVDPAGLGAIDAYQMSKGLSWTHWQGLYAGSKRYRGIRPGIVTKQTFVSPSNGVLSYMYNDEADFEAANFNSVPPLDMSSEAYAARADELLEVTTRLTDYQKAVAELANNKIWGSLFMIIQGGINLLVNKVGLDKSSEEYIRMYEDYSYVTSNCELAATHVAWRSKRTQYAGRPATIIPELYKRNATFAAKWGGAAENYTSYITPGDHPDYVSGSSVIYSGFVWAGDYWFAHHYPEHFGLADGLRASQQTGEVKLEFPAHSWDWSDGPSEPITVKWDNLWKWVEDLPHARMYGGVHFKDAGEAGVNLGQWVGKRCFEIQQRLKAGDMTATWTYGGKQHVSLFKP